MKLILINPPRWQPLDSNVPSWVELDTGAYPPLGLLYLASSARARTGCEVSVIDGPSSNITYDEISRLLSAEAPDVVGISALSFSMPDVVHCARLVRQLLPKTHICIGGPHAHLYPEETLRLGICDSVVLGEGELSFPELLNSLARTGTVPEIPGVAFLRDGAFVSTDPVTIDDLDALPFPDRTLLPISSYRSALAKHSPITTMMTSRGCPCKCVYCDRPAMGKRFRARSASSVVDEMEECVRLGIREIFFYDDTFTINRPRVVEICDLIADRRLKIDWDIRARIDTMDKPLLEILARAGCRRIHYGVEAGTDRIQKVLHKNLDLTRTRQVLAWTRDAGITSLAYFMIGNPSETLDEVNTTLRLARDLKPDFIHLSITTPFPGTELYFMAMRQGVVKDDPWRAFARDPRPDFVPPLWLENFTRDELRAVLKKGYSDFYLRPGYILRSVLRLRTPSEFWRKARAGFGLLLGKRK